MSECDVLFSIGTRFNDRITGKISEFAPNATIVHIDIDASEINKNVKVSESLVGDARDILRQLMPLIKETRHDEWTKKIAEWRTEDYVPE